MSPSGCHDSNNVPDPKFRVCLIGESLKGNVLLIKSIKIFGLPIVQSSNGLEYMKKDAEFTTIYILDEFEGEVYNTLHKAGQRILGPTTLIQCAVKNKPLLNNIRPLYTASMKNLVISFSGFRVMEELSEMITLIHHMGGSIRTDYNLSETTYLIANSTGGEKYRYAARTGTPIMTSQWIYELWERRHDPSCNATNPEFGQYRLLPFVGCKIALVGYLPDEAQPMIEVLSRYGGEAVTPDDSSCTHAVVRDGLEEYVEASDYSHLYLVKNEWFWACIRMKAKVEERIYAFENEETDFSMLNPESDKRSEDTAELSISDLFQDATLSPGDILAIVTLLCILLVILYFGNY